MNHKLRGSETLATEDSLRNVLFILIILSIPITLSSLSKSLNRYIIAYIERLVNRFLPLHSKPNRQAHHISPSSHINARSICRPSKNRQRVFFFIFHIKCVLDSNCRFSSNSLLSKTHHCFLVRFCEVGQYNLFVRCLQVCSVEHIPARHLTTSKASFFIYDLGAFLFSKTISHGFSVVLALLSSS